MLFRQIGKGKLHPEQRGDRAGQLRQVFKWNNLRHVPERDGGQRKHLRAFVYCESDSGSRVSNLCDRMPCLFGKRIFAFDSNADL